MAKNDKIARWSTKRTKHQGDRIYVSRNHEGSGTANSNDNAVYIETHSVGQFATGTGASVTVEEAREVAAAIIAAADEFELILAEPDVIEPSIREQVEALPVGSTFRVHFEEGSAEYLRSKSGLTLYRATYNDQDGIDETPHDMDVDLPAWRFALTLEILHLAG